MKRIPQRTIERALIYIRTLEGLLKDGREKASSGELASMTGFSDVQIRKDIQSFGRVGIPRVGYDIVRLKEKLEHLILHEKEIKAVLFGVGNLGTAILKYPWARKGRIKIVAAFDPNPARTGRQINGVSIYPLSDAFSVIRKTGAEIGIVAVPEERGQEVADVMVSSGLKGIANFAPCSLSVPRGIPVKNIDLSIEFMSLFFDSRPEKLPRKERPVVIT